jgi:hypothetical protein
LLIEPFPGDGALAGRSVSGVEENVDVQQDHLNPSPSA